MAGERRIKRMSPTALSTYKGKDGELVKSNNTLYMMDGENNGGMSVGGSTAYTKFITNRSGTMSFTFAEFNKSLSNNPSNLPDVSVICGRYYIAFIKSYNDDGFTVQVCQPDGTQEVDVQNILTLGETELNSEETLATEVPETVAKLLIRFFVS